MCTFVIREYFLVRHFASRISYPAYVLYSMWHELRVVLHNRENTLLTQIVRDFARDESAFAEVVSSTWGSLAEAVENMPYE